MRVGVPFGDGLAEFETGASDWVAVWTGPTDLPETRLSNSLAEALEHPLDYPALASSVVPGDRVVIPLDNNLPAAGIILRAVWEVLDKCGVEPTDLRVLSRRQVARGLRSCLPEGTEWTVHDPNDRANLAYLASTKAGRRVYLNRAMLDADVVFPVGLLSFEPMHGHRGPWSLVFPGLSDGETQTALDGSEEALRDEAGEVNWLLGCQLQMGVVAGQTGAHQVLVAQESAMRGAGPTAVDSAWKFTVPDRSEVVLASLSRDLGDGQTLDDLASALSSATAAVRQGGKVVLLTEVEDQIGPAFRALVEADDPRQGPSLLRKARPSDDLAAARMVALALAWADVYLVSRLDPDLVENLGILPLDQPSEARRILASATSLNVIASANRTIVRLEEADQGD